VIARWQESDWTERSESELDEALGNVGRARTGPITQERVWGRSCIQRAPTSAGEVWIKHGYSLPPGEDVVLATLPARWPDRLPGVVTTWPGTVVLEPLPGDELTPDHPAENWIDAARSLGELLAGEAEHAAEWLEAGARDRRPAAFRAAVFALMESEALEPLPGYVRRRFDDLVPGFATRYEDAFHGPSTLVPQDSGCCNIHLTPDGPVFFDWADVVVGHPVFSGDRLLDQVSPDRRSAVIAAFIGPLGIDEKRFRAMRRSNVLHEILRYHDELAHIPRDDETHHALAQSVRSQIGTLVA
jgi:hypothetical protein